ncbi:MAG TPA: type II toxin-antitoxin system antitoxin SocA domain-containing protein [Ignavibacteria bacterium]|nr:type II toxin-antitoxin system antitoxin SocA domain-containing protein [Ignavibacteria bacterium]
MIDQKTKDLILYLVNELKDKEDFGATLLNKTLLYIDFLHYYNTGKPLTSFEYIHQQYGITPKFNQLQPIINELIAEKKIKREVKKIGTKDAKKLVPEGMIEYPQFSETEAKTILEGINYIRDKNASEMTDNHHRGLAWRLTKGFENIPFNALLLTKSDEITDEDLEWINNSFKNWQNRANYTKL